jgi:hypothetical protein
LVNAPLTVLGGITINDAGTLDAAADITANQLLNRAALKMSGGATLAAALSNATDGWVRTDASRNTIVGNVASASLLSVGGLGRQPGSLQITGNYTQTGNGALYLHASNDGTYSTLTVSGTATLGGTLGVAPNADIPAKPTRDKTSTAVSAGNIVGKFSAARVTWGKLAWNISYSDSSVILSVVRGAAVPANGAPSRRDNRKPSGR